MVAIQLTHVYSPGLKLPHYEKQGRGAPILADFSNGRVVVPVQMLKDHVQSEAIRAYPTDAPHASTGLSPPAATGLTKNLPIKPT
jgi:phage terminase large subunit-like protein